MRLALDSLDSAKLDEAVRAFERTAAELPRYAPALAGLANAYMLQYEKTRSARMPDRRLLERAFEVRVHPPAVDLALLHALRGSAQARSRQALTARFAPRRLARSSVLQSRS